MADFSPSNLPMTFESPVTNLGCYPVGSEVSALAFAEVVHAQMRLRDLGLLSPCG